MIVFRIGKRNRSFLVYDMREEFLRWSNDKIIKKICSKRDGMSFTYYIQDKVQMHDMYFWVRTSVANIMGQLQ